ncbi:GNAT family N-acetyltransferase [Cnuibacter sp. UC19_7]|uniref:GNAT family N-acetyltransferase n=1 Tax=Cnuibacter sp. UC19_7 TaxID=3350166 RepID=UPI00366F02EE
MSTTIRPWTDADLPLLVGANDPAMTAHLGGPETEQKVRERHAKYLSLVESREAGIFAIELDGVAVGCANWWQSEWHGEDVVEMGWFVVPEAQGRGVAVKGVAAVLDDAWRRADRRRVLAFPAVENVPSNRVCAHVGFERISEEDFPYRDTVLRVAVWSLQLGAPPSAD